MRPQRSAGAHLGALIACALAAAGLLLAFYGTFGWSELAASDYEMTGSLWECAPVLLLIGLPAIVVGATFITFLSRRAQRLAPH